MTGAAAFRANPPPLDISAMEDDLARIPAVSSARVVIEDEEVREVHVVCGGGRSAKIVSRDAQSLLAARWGIEVDHRKISVVQLQDPEAPAGGGPDLDIREGGDGREERRAAPGGPEPVIISLAVSMTGVEGETAVTVELGGRVSTGRATGGPSWTGQRRLAALAALEAICELHPRAAGLTLADITAVRLGSDEVVVVTVTGWRDGFERSWAGAAPIGAAGELRAAAEAVLRAVPI